MLSTRPYAKQHGRISERGLDHAQHRPSEHSALFRRRSAERRGQPHARHRTSSAEIAPGVSQGAVAAFELPRAHLVRLCLSDLRWDAVSRGKSAYSQVFFIVKDW